MNNREQIAREKAEILVHGNVGCSIDPVEFAAQIILDAMSEDDKALAEWLVNSDGWSVVNVLGMDTTDVATSIFMYRTRRDDVKS